MLFLMGLTIVLAQLPGGVFDGDKKDAHVHELMAKHLQRLKTGDDGELKVIEVTKISQQVVQGKLYRVKGKFQQGAKTINCDLEIWERVWIEGDEGLKIDADCGEPEAKKKFTSY